MAVVEVLYGSHRSELEQTGIVSDELGKLGIGTTFVERPRFRDRLKLYETILDDEHGFIVDLHAGECNHSDIFELILFNMPLWKVLKDDTLSSRLFDRIYILFRRGKTHNYFKEYCLDKRHYEEDSRSEQKDDYDFHDRIKVNRIDKNYLVVELLGHDESWLRGYVSPRIAEFVQLLSKY